MTVRTTRINHGTRVQVSGSDPMAVGGQWPDQMVALNALGHRAAAAGLLGLNEALDWLGGRPGWQDADDDQLLDAMVSWALHMPGSPIVWDRARPTTLTRPVQRALAACGSLTVAELHAGLLRARNGNAGPAIPPSVDHLAAWVTERDDLTVDGDRVALLDVKRPNVLLTAPDKVLLRSARRAKGPMKAGVLQERLLAANACSTPGSAKVAVHSAPYLQTAGRGWVQLSGRAAGESAG